MKTKSLITWLAAGTMLVGLASCNNQADNTPVFKSLTVDTSAAKTSYVAGEEFSAEGIKVTVEFSNADPVVLTSSDFTVTAPSTAEPGQATVKLSYEGHDVYYTISILAKEFKLRGLELDTSNVRTEFIIGEEFSSEGLVVRGIYSQDGDENNPIMRNISDYQVSAVDTSAKGVKEVTVSYQEEEAKYSVNVSEAWYQYIERRYDYWVEFDGDIALPLDSLAGYDVTYEETQDDYGDWIYDITAEGAADELFYAVFELLDAGLFVADSDYDTYAILLGSEVNEYDEVFSLALSASGSDLEMIAGKTYLYSAEEISEYVSALLGDGIPNAAPGFGYSSLAISDVESLEAISDYFYLGLEYSNIAVDAIAEITQGSKKSVMENGYNYLGYVEYEGKATDLADILEEALDSLLDLDNFELVGDPYFTTDAEWGYIPAQRIVAEDGSTEGRVFVYEESFYGIFTFDYVLVELAAVPGCDDFDGVTLDSITVSSPNAEGFAEILFASILAEEQDEEENPVWRVDDSHLGSYGYMFYSNEQNGEMGIEGQISPLAGYYFDSFSVSFGENFAQTEFSKLDMHTFIENAGFATEIPTLFSEEDVELYMWQELSSDPQYGEVYLAYTYDYLPKYDGRASLVDEFAALLAAEQDDEENPLWVVKAGEGYVEAKSVETQMVDEAEKQITLQFYFDDDYGLFILAAYLQEVPGPFKADVVAELLADYGFEGTVVPTPAGENFVYRSLSLTDGTPVIAHTVDCEAEEGAELVAAYHALFDENDQWELADFDEESGEYLFISTELVDTYPEDIYYLCTVVDFYYDADDGQFAIYVYCTNYGRTAYFMNEDCEYWYVDCEFPYLPEYLSAGFYDDSYNCCAYYYGEEAAEAYIAALEDSDDWAYVGNGMAVSYATSFYYEYYGYPGYHMVAIMEPDFDDEYNLVGFYLFWTWGAEGKADVSDLNEYAVEFNGEEAAQFADASGLGLDLILVTAEPQYGLVEGEEAVVAYVEAYVKLVEDEDEANAFMALLAEYAEACGMIDLGDGFYSTEDFSIYMYVAYDAEQGYVGVNFVAQYAEE